MNVFRSRKQKAAKTNVFPAESDDEAVDIPQTSSKLDYEKLQQIIVQKQEEMSELQRQLSTTSIMSYDMLRANDELLAHYVGLPNNAMYECLLQFCEQFSFSVTT